MAKSKLVIAFFVMIVLAAMALPVFALDYNPGVLSGQYVKYGNFVGIGPGVEAFNDYDWLKLTVTSVSGKEVTLLSMGQFKNGTATPGNNSIDVWNIETGTDNGVPSTQGPIIAANLNQGDAIPPAGTYTINSTETRTYLGVSRSVNILNVSIATPDYNTTLNYVYDKASGMLLESKSQTTVQGQPEPITSTYSYSITETNIFGSTSVVPTATTSTTPTTSAAPITTTTPTTSAMTPSPTVPEFSSPAIELTLLITLIAVTCTAVILSRRKRAAR